MLSPLTLHLSNAGLFIVAWLVQLWIYPAFSRLHQDEFFKWQSRYQPIIIIITLPLMIMQAIGHTENIFAHQQWIHVIQWIGCLITFILTFGIAVPVHLKMKKAGNSKDLMNRLLTAHTFRTISWTIIFVLDFIKFRM